MRLEWLEDIVAVIDTGPFNATADRRYVTQPVFSRRIRAIEDYLSSQSSSTASASVWTLTPSADIHACTAYCRLTCR